MKQKNNMSKLLINIRIAGGLGINVFNWRGCVIEFHKLHAVRARFGKAARAAILFQSPIILSLTPSRYAEREIAAASKHLPRRCKFSRVVYQSRDEVGQKPGVRRVFESRKTGGDFR